MQAAFCAELLPLWINEVLSDAGTKVGPTGTDQGEFVELVGPVGRALGGFEVEITDCTGTSYTYTLDPFTIIDDGNLTNDGFGFFVLADLSTSAPGDQDLPANGSNAFGEASEHLPDVTGAVILRDGGGQTVFEYAYGVALTCTGLTNRGAGDTTGPGVSVGFSGTGSNKPDDADDGMQMTSSSGSENTGQVLPVELTTFEAMLDGADALLRWTTASETNNAGFEIQRAAPIPTRDLPAPDPSTQIPSWEPLAFVEGHGTTVEVQVYVFRVADLAPGPHRFRLRQLDYDGTFAYSPEVEVTVGVPGAFRLSAPYPNPFAGRLQVSLSVARAQRVAVEVFDATGRRVATLFDGALTAGTTRALTFDGAALPAGLYLLRASGEFFDTSRAVIRLR